MRLTLSKCLVSSLAAIALFVANSVQAEEWEWTIAPYLWASNVGLDLTVNDNVAIGGDASFKDLLDKVDNVFMGHFEGHKGRWGMYLDTIYLNLSDNNTMPVGPGGPVLGDFTADAGMKMKLYDAGGLYRLMESADDVQFDLLAGVRHIDVDVNAELTFPGPMMNQVNIQTGPSETDVMLGARIITRFAERWHWAVRGDVSFGGSEGTYNGLASMGYTFGKSGLFTMTFGYRYMSIKVDGMTQRGGSSEADLSLSGPLLGFVFNF